jgi:hypothetical protein
MVMPAGSRPGGQPGSSLAACDRRALVAGALGAGRFPAGGFSVVARLFFTEYGVINLAHASSRRAGRGPVGHEDPAAFLPELDARSVPHVIRHATILGALDSVSAASALVLVAPQDPLPLLAQLEQRSRGRSSSTNSKVVQTAGGFASSAPEQGSRHGQWQLSRAHPQPGGDESAGVLSRLAVP